MDGVREWHYPRFVELFEQEYNKRLWNTQDFAPVQYMCEHVGNAAVVRAQARDACVALWMVLKDVPRELAGTDTAEFLVGYTPQQGVPLSSDDNAKFLSWQRILSRLFAWSVEVDLAGGDDARAKSFQQEFLDLLDEIDILLVPRLKFWRQFVGTNPHTDCAQPS